MSLQNPSAAHGFSAIIWQNDQLKLLDQRRLPLEELWIDHDDVDAIVASIRDMVVRGAPAIGITAAYGVAIAGRNCFARSGGQWKQVITEDLNKLAGSRPTAVNLFWALEKLQGVIAGLPADEDPYPRLLKEAKRIHEEDLHFNLTMGALGADLMRREAQGGHAKRGVITHCNTGALATGGYGTALGVIRSAWHEGLIEQVHADETRPWLQGSRLTAWELARDGIPVSLNADSAAAYLMAQGGISWVITGADRITANGDVANKIGTYSLAVLARYHGVKFMVVAPSTTFDLALACGAEIPIEERTAEEVLMVAGRRLAPANCNASNPVFDVTPAHLIDAIVTEKGVIESPCEASVRRVLQSA